MNKIKIMVTGSSPQEVPILPGETLYNLIRRISTRDFPLAQVGSWYVGSGAVPSAKALILRDGMVVAGAPAQKPTSFTMRCFGHEWKAWIDQRYGNPKGLHSVLLEAVGWCLERKCPNMALERRNELARDALMVQDWYADGELIEDPARFHLFSEMVISAGTRRSKIPTVKLDMRPHIDIVLHNVRRARKLGVREADLGIQTLRITPGEMLVDLIGRLKFEKEDMGPFPVGHHDAGQRLVRETWVHGEKVENPSTFALKAGMPINIFLRRIKDAAAA